MTGRQSTPIAIIGIGCRLPGGVTSTADFWDVLRNGIDCISEVPADRWSLDAFHDKDQRKQGKMVSKRSGFINGIDQFDNTFFKISPKEASSMDPQQRILLEVTHEAFEDAGYVPSKLKSSCGVFVGIGFVDYTIMGSNISTINAYTLTGSAHCVAANRLSYAFNLKGPSYAVDTACASSMTAMHLACSAMWNQECDMAVLAGANALIIPETTIGFSSLGVLSPDGKCCPFSNSANGYVRSEGWGTMILKPLHDAIKDNDHIYAQIVGTYIAANGHSNSLTMPSTPAQQHTMEETYRRFDVNMADVDYLEAHGTGTPVGDPIEAEAIGNAFGPHKSDPLRIGSVKSNFGHCEYASGIVSSIKVALMLQKGYLVPTINYTTPNVNIHLDEWKLHVQTSIKPFPKDKDIIVGINSFGFAGALAHAIIQSPPSQKQNVLQYPAGWGFNSNFGEGESIIIPLSAKSTAALTDTALRWKSFESNEDALRVVGWQATKRAHHDCRLALIASSWSEFRNRLEQFIQDGSGEGLSIGTSYRSSSKICFVFPGQGQQWANMGRTLYATEPVFRDTIEKCDEIFRQVSGSSLVYNCNLFYGNYNSEFILDDENINDMEISQPAILFLQIALYELWRHWGVSPDVVVGHSLGEVAASYACGGLTLTEAVKVIYQRSKNQSLLKGVGSMVAVRLSLGEAEDICMYNENVYIAAVNASRSLTIGGSKDSILRIVNNSEIQAKQLRVQCAFHTPLMDPIEKPFRKSMEGAVITPAGSRSIPFYSTLTGTQYDGDFNTEYWWKNIRNRVKFQSAIESILKEIEVNVFIECSASATLLSSIKQIARSESESYVITVPSGQRQQDDRNSILYSLGQLYTHGVEINWQNVTRDAAQWVDIPKYPWQHSSLWVEDPDHRNHRLGKNDRTFRGQNGALNFKLFPFLAEHVVQDRIVFPAAGYVEYALQSFFLEDELPVAANFNFNRVYTWPDVSDSMEQAYLNLKCTKDGNRVTVTTAEQVYSTCILLSTNEIKTNHLNIEDILKRCRNEQSMQKCYEKLKSLGLQYGPSFQVVTRVMAGDGECLGYLCPADDNKQRIQVTHLDGAFQLLLHSIGYTTTLFIPVAISHLEMYTPKIPPFEEIVSYAKVTECDSVTLLGDITMATKNGKILALISGVKCQALNGIQSNIDIDRCLYQTHWQPSTSCLGSTSVLQEVFQCMKNNDRYSVDLESIRKVEGQVAIIKGICASYVRHGLENGNKGTFKLNTRYLKCLERIAADQSVLDIKYEAIHVQLNELKDYVPEFELEIEMIRSIGDNLSRTLVDPESAVKILLQPEFLPKYFIESLTTRLYYKSAADTISKIIKNACKQKHVVRVLELGGRVGGLARHILEPLKLLGEENRVEYIFTYLSATYLMHAQSTLEEYSFVKYKQLDIEADVSTQGFTPCSIDLVVCFDAIHPVVDIISTLQNVRDLLVDDGLFLMYEVTNTNYITELVFGVLDLCWVYDDYRKYCCWLTRDGYVQALLNSGFTDVVSESTPGEFFHSVFLGRCTLTSDEPKQKTKDRIYMLVVENEQCPLIKDIKKCLTCDVIVKSYADVKSEDFDEESQDLPYELIYLWGDSDRLCHALLKVLQMIDSDPKRISKLWVVTCGSNMTYTNIECSPSIGLVRAVTNQSNVPVFSVDIDPNSPVAKQVQLLVAYVVAPVSYEREVAIRNGSYFYPRLASYIPTTKMAISGQTYWQLTQTSKSGLSSISDLGISYRTEMVPSPGKVLVKVKSAALNFKDVMMALGMLDDLLKTDGKPFGLELSGVVETVGEGVSTISVGDEVIGIGEHCFASHSICDAQLIVKKPSTMSWDESAGISIVFATSYHSLVERANLQKGETVLIHSACGGVGLSAIQVARMVDADIICTAGTKNKRKFLKETLGIAHVTDSRSDAFYADVMRWTNNRGVDVVLNSLYGELLTKGVKTLAPGGRFCEIGKRDILQSSNLDMQLLLENKSFLSCQIDFMVDLQKDKAQKLLQKVSSLLEKGILKRVQYAAYSLAEYNDVFLTAAKGSHIGKIVFSIPDNFQQAKINRSSVLFEQNATYVITGAFGGIGLAMSRWITTKGARHVVMVSRRGCQNSAGRRAMKFMKNKGVTIYEFAIDLGKKKNVEHMLEQIYKRAPSIKGFFHLAGYIAPESLQTLNPSETNKILYSKAISAQYLHSLTKDQDLDVFFMLSSVASLWGHSSQPMYAAANNFLDSLAELRRRQGLASLSVQLGPIRGAGFLESNSEITNTLASKGNNTLHVEEFLNTLSTLLQSSDVPAVVCLANQVWTSIC
ncbi:phthiocerol synthesis polyketide synthase type I PpsC-like isoform X2 [Anneissia japonica]|uniref:phthiocerol synthesis polyketide synthase type I PpsC-like isoform X2 n=1 Tax=Anneissia japonica TaxID=1529436 RepID=UPI001425736F|nr:phthiocerol synthesis polyketide synthase type I PpsC-like isoform X2 [Anneissia japonica]